MKSRWRTGLRLRYAVMATGLAALTFVVGGAVALTLYHESLVSTVDGSTLGAAKAVAASARRGPLPNPIPMPVATSVPRIQVLSSAGQVASGDPASASAPPMLALAREAAHGMTTVANPANLPERRAAAIAIRITSPSGPLTIIAAGSLDPTYTKTDQAIEFSAILGGISLLVVALAAWGTAGRTLRRVERIRAQVAAITASGDLAQRVPALGSDEIAHLGSTLNQMLASMSISTERQRRFVADAAHELRTPIAGLSASLDVALRHPETVDHPTWVAELADGHRRLGRLVNDLLVLASLDGGAPTHRQPVDVTGIVTDSVRRPNPAGVRLRASTVDNAVVHGDASQLTRLITNLVDNALRYARSSVEVSLAVENGQAVLSVADDGPGIPPDQRERIWGRFVRLDDDRSRAGGGSGLGLAMVKDLAASHGGTVSVINALAGGAIFTVRLPVALPQTPGDSDSPACEGTKVAELASPPSEG